MERRTLLGAFNLQPALALAGLLTATGVLTRTGWLTQGAGIGTLASASMLTTAMRRRHQALGGGGALRAHELARRWFWQPGPARVAGERVRVGAQAEVVHHTPWNPEIPYVSLQAPGDRQSPAMGVRRRGCRWGRGSTSS